jgi:hypothetical protein
MKHTRSKASFKPDYWPRNKSMSVRALLSAARRLARSIACDLKYSSSRFETQALISCEWLKGKSESGTDVRVRKEQLLPTICNYCSAARRGVSLSF